MTARDAHCRGRDVLRLALGEHAARRGRRHAFLRTPRAAFGEQHAAEFLLLDRLFPRSHRLHPWRRREALCAGWTRRPADCGRGGCRAGYSAAPGPSWSTAREPRRSSTCPSACRAAGQACIRGQRRGLAAVLRRSRGGPVARRGRSVSTTLRIVHRSGYTYTGGATASFNEVRMTHAPATSSRSCTAGSTSARCRGPTRTPTTGARPSPRSRSWSDTTRSRSKPRAPSTCNGIPTTNPGWAG